MENEKDCYIGINTKGTIMAAMVMEGHTPAETAATIASWIMEGLTIQPAHVEEVREKLWKGERTEPLGIRYHIQIVIAGKSDFEVECEGDDDLNDEYTEYERYGNEPDYWQAEEEESDSSNAVADNQLPLF